MNYNNTQLVFDKVPSGKIGWSSPSNIALVKYWGKKGIQLPINPSISFTLRKSVTETIVDYSPAKNGKNSLDFYFDGIPNPKFAKKTSEFFDKIMDIFPFLSQLDFVINSKNTFPHSTGIASSASGMSALALALCDIENKYFNSFKSSADFYRKASYISRLGSGSACRSVYGGAVSWGQSNIMQGSSDLFATKLNFEINPVYETYQDSIIIVDPDKKSVSSTAGHKLMKSNPFTEQRIIQANNNIEELVSVLGNGELFDFIKIIENEALSLHALMMTSHPAFILMKPSTIAIINELWKYREDTKVPLGFTLDAGPNIHLLYPKESQVHAIEFIESVKKYSSGTVIKDEVGNGPEKLDV